MRASVVILAVMVGWGTARAQKPPAGSRYLPLDHWGYEYIARLRDRGYLSDLNPLVQPYRRLDVARGLQGLDPDTLSRPVAEWVRLLQDELKPELDRLAGKEAQSYGFVAMAGGRASSSFRLDPARPDSNGAGAWPWWRGGAWVESGPLAIETRLYGDLYYNDDPDGLNPGQGWGGRSDNAYLSLSLPRVTLSLGRFSRNWSALGTAGLMVSDVPTPYPSVAMDLVLGRVTFSAFTGELDTILGQKRYLSGHTLSYRRSQDFYVSFGETVLYASQRGGLSLRFLNPVELLLFDKDGEPADMTVNLMLNAEAWLRKGALTMHGEFLLDDFDVSGTPGLGRAPTRYGFDVTAKWVSPAQPLALSAEYRQVSSFAYRTSYGVDVYTYLQRGLGDNFADYDRLTATLEWTPPLHGLIVAPALLVQRQGEGGIREPFPATPPGFFDSPSLFLGVRETTWRAALRGRYQPLRQLWFAWDVGPNVVHNKDHVVGASKTEFEGTGEVGVRLELP